MAWQHAEVDVTILKIEEQFIHTYILDKQCHWNFFFTFVYGQHTIKHRKSLLASLNVLASSVVDSP